MGHLTQRELGRAIVAQELGAMREKRSQGVELARGQTVIRCHAARGSFVSKTSFRKIVRRGKGARRCRRRGAVLQHVTTRAADLAESLRAAGGIAALAC